MKRTITHITFLSLSLYTFNLQPAPAVIHLSHIGQHTHPSGLSQGLEYFKNTLASLFVLDPIKLNAQEKKEHRRKMGMVQADFSLFINQLLTALQEEENADETRKNFEAEIVGQTLDTAKSFQQKISDFIATHTHDNYENQSQNLVNDTTIISIAQQHAKQTKIVAQAFSLLRDILMLEILERFYPGFKYEKTKHTITQNYTDAKLDDLKTNLFNDLQRIDKDIATSMQKRLDDFFKHTTIAPPTSLTHITQFLKYPALLSGLIYSHHVAHRVSSPRWTRYKGIWVPLLGEVSSTLQTPDIEQEAARLKRLKKEDELLYFFAQQELHQRYSKKNVSLILKHVHQ